MGRCVENRINKWVFEIRESNRLKRLAMESTNGSIILSNVEVVEYVELDITNGSLEVKHVNAGEYVTA